MCAYPMLVHFHAWSTLPKAYNTTGACACERSVSGKRSGAGQKSGEWEQSREPSAEQSQITEGMLDDKFQFFYVV